MLVSVLITTYDYGRFLGAAIESVAEQDYSPLELVIVDDGSGDDSPAIIADAAARHAARFERFAAIRFARNRGRLHALNHAIPHLRGELTVILDADDRLAPSFVRETAEHLNGAAARDARIAFVYTDCWLIDEGGASLARGCSARYDGALLRTSSYIPSCATAFTSAWRAVLPFDETPRAGEKHYRWQRLAASGRRGVHLAQPLFFYRMHDRNVSGIGRKVARACAAGDQSISLLSGVWPTAVSAFLPDE